ncbi:MAG: YwiC-like family protein [Corynebacterium sp.]|nr:YwiC-like family protein [Corynebacterium sp.]
MTFTDSASRPQSRKQTNRKPTPRRGKKRSRRSPGWVPNQHGAWFMVIVPPLVGLALAPAWSSVPIILAWWLGYFAFFAASVWLRSRMNKRHLPPLAVYGTGAVIAAVVALVTAWPLITWGALYAPLVAIAVYEAWKRRPRSLLSGWSTVLAASLMTPTLVSASPSASILAQGTTPGAVSAATLDSWAIALIFALYFGGSIFYVKTLIRDFGNRARFLQSVIFHGACTGAAVVATVFYRDWWAVTLVSIVMLARAWALPRYAQRTGRRIKPGVVGMIDMVVALLVLAAALIAVR